MLMLATVLPAGTSIKNNKINVTAPSTLQTGREVNWNESQKLLASDGVSLDSFGYSVSIDGETALIGACYDDGSKGSVYVFTRSGTTWSEQTKLFASDGISGDLFGYSVSLSGNTALIGMPWDDDNMAQSGSAYVFVRSGDNWTQQQKLLPSDGAEGDYFGYSVSLSGNTALIGALLHDENLGSAYVFTRTGTNWAEQQKLLGNDSMYGDEFGSSVSIDGDTALIGAYGDDGTRGSAYVFIRNGDSWSQQAKLLAENGAMGDLFGISVSIEGDTVVIGADEYYANTFGSTYIFTRTGTTWTQEAKLTDPGGMLGDRFGYSVSLNDDTVLIGVLYGDGYWTNTGSAFIFTRIGTTWTQQAKLMALDGQVWDWFGGSVSVDGDTAFIGVMGDDDNGGESGSVYVFTKESENEPPVADFSWTPQNPDPNQPVNFNASLSYDSDGTITLYEWDWDNVGGYDESNDVPTAQHTWVSEGIYPVTLRVTDDEGAINTTTKSVFVGKVDVPEWKKGDSWTYTYHRVEYRYNGTTPWYKQNYSCTMILTITNDTGANYTAKITSKDTGGSITIGKFQLKCTKWTKLSCDVTYRKTDLGNLYEVDQIKGPVIWLIGGKLPFPAQYQSSWTFTFIPAWVFLPFPFSAGDSGMLPAYHGTIEEKCALYWGFITLMNQPSTPYNQGTLPYQCEMANVTVPAGTYNAYNVSIDIPIGTQGHYSDWKYYDPNVGYVVKQCIYGLTTWGAPQYDIVQELVSTTYTP